MTTSVTTTDRERLELLDEKRSAIIDAMDAISERFVGRLATELPDRWAHIVRLFVTSRPFEAAAQGRQGLSRLKRALHRLQARAPLVAESHLSGPDVWEHLAANTEGDHAGAGSPVVPESAAQRRSRISAPVKRAEAEVLPLLEAVFDGCGDAWQRGVQGKLSESMERMIQAYDRLSTHWAEVETERNTLIRRIASEEAERLWDSV